MNNFFDKIIGKLFQAQNGPLVAGPLKRTAPEQQEYLRWASGPAAAETLRKVRQAISGSHSRTFKAHLLRTPYANGFALYTHTGNAGNELRLLADLLKDRVKSLGYVSQLAERQEYDRAQYVETVEKNYLKPPPPTDFTQLFNQLYGNILIQYVLYNQQPAYLKLVASVYSDRLYTTALPYEELEGILLES